MLGSKLIRAAIKVPAEVLNSMDIRMDRELGEAAAPRLFDHELT